MPTTQDKKEINDLEPAIDLEDDRTAAPEQNIPHDSRVGKPDNRPGRPDNRVGKQDDRPGRPDNR